jgi:signal transduction histidine kinase
MHRYGRVVAGSTARTVTNGGRSAAPGGSAAYRPVVPILAVTSALSALIGDAGEAVDNVIVTVAVIPFVVWWLRPRVPALVVVVIAAAAVLRVTRDSDLEASMFLLSIAATVVGGYEPSPVKFVLGGLILATVPIIGLVVFENDTATGVWVMGIILPLVLSRVERRQLETVEALTAARAALADQQVLEERRRIARDVHDSVGHGLAAVLLHITGARHVLRRDVDAADEALAEAEQVGRRSMQELRETLGLLRSGIDDGFGNGPAQPVPRLDDVGRDDVWRRFVVTGDVGRIDPLTATSLHRVAEEAFTNALRHAPDARTAATLDVRDREVVMTIESFGAFETRHDTEARPRYGIVGMSERMAAVGGTIDVGPTAAGWLVRAAVPLRDGASRDAKAAT